MKKKSVQAKCNGVEDKLSRVKTYLDKLSTLIEEDKKISQIGFKTLQEFNHQSSSASPSNSLSDLQQIDNLHHSVDQIEEFPHFQYKSLTEYNKKQQQHHGDYCQKESQLSSLQNQKRSEEMAGDVTVKKINKKKNIEAIKKQTQQYSTHKTDYKNDKAKVNSKNSRLKITKMFNQVETDNKSGIGIKSAFPQSNHKRSNISIKQKKTDSNKFSCLNLSPKCFSPTNYNINLQKEILMKINKLKTKKNLCQIQSSYLQASIKVTKKQIQKVLNLMNNYSDESMLNTFMIKIIIKFLSQFQQQIYDFDLLSDDKSDFLIKALQKPQRLIKIINKLPQIIRKNSILSQIRCKQLFQEKRLLVQRIEEMEKTYLYENSLCQYLISLHNYVEFLLNNNMIHQTKRIKIFAFIEEEFFSDRSVKKHNIHIQQKIREASSRKIIKIKDIQQQYDSDRNRNNSAIKLKRMHTSNNLKKDGKLKKVKK